MAGQESLRRVPHRDVDLIHGVWLDRLRTLVPVPVAQPHQAVAEPLGKSSSEPSW